MIQRFARKDWFTPNIFLFFNYKHCDELYSSFFEIWIVLLDNTTKSRCKIRKVRVRAVAERLNSTSVSQSIISRERLRAAQVNYNFKHKSQCRVHRNFLVKFTGKVLVPKRALLKNCDFRNQVQITPRICKQAYGGTVPFFKLQRECGFRITTTVFKLN